ncbi:MAG: tRNA pseudouridine(55) synthase TruB [Dehalococcoidia bacterium]
MELFGILNVHKPRGWTSFDVVALVRRLSGVRRVGHAGTLDPAATGVLPVCLGQATRLAEYLMAATKTYRAQVQLGVATDTYDAEGADTFDGDPSGLTPTDVEGALASFRGRIRQAPPPFSAVKHRGEPLYRYARSGAPVAEVKEREVFVHRIQVLEFSSPFLTVEVECGSGTYIRSLAHDLGRKLGCGAHLRSLVRTRVGPFTLAEACTVDQLRAVLAEGWWPEVVQYPDVMLTHWWAAILGDESEKALRMGRALLLGGQPPAEGEPEVRGELCRAYSLDGHLIAVLRRDGYAGVWRPVKVLSPPRTGEI